MVVVYTFSSLHYLCCLQDVFAHSIGHVGVHSAKSEVSAINVEIVFALVVCNCSLHKCEPNSWPSVLHSLGWRVSSTTTLTQVILPWRICANPYMGESAR